MPRPKSNPFWNNAVFKDVRGQEAIEYALMVGFAALATAATVPGIALNISKILSKLGAVCSGVN